jgi:hypothetical protein
LKLVQMLDFYLDQVEEGEGEVVEDHHQNFDFDS